MNQWQKFFEEKIKELAKSEIVYDIGGGRARQDKNKFKNYVVVDINPEYKPDIIAGIQNLPFENGSIEAILCMSVFEHVENPFKASEEIFRVLKPGGKVLLSLPFIWPYHAASDYKDYWRFSEDGIRVLFKDFSNIEIAKAGGYFSALTNFIPSFTKIDRILRPIAALIDALILKTKRSTTPAYYVFLIK